MSMSKKASRQKDLTKKVLCSLLAAGVLSVGLPMGEALAAEFIGQTVENQQHSGWGNLQREDLTISGSTYQHNTNEDADGPAGGALSTYSASKQLTVTISDSTFAFNKAVTTSEKQDIGSGALGGAMVIKGSKLTLTDVDFHNNTVETSTGKAFAAGGAIYLDATINGSNKFPTEAKIIATKNITYAGNDVVGNGADVWYANTYGALAQSSGGFMFLDRNASAEFSVADGATLTIGNADATGNMDSIASAIPLNITDGNKYAELSKTGVGTLTINSDLNKYYGTLNVADGTMNVNKDWTVKNTVTVNGGILNIADVTLDKIPQTITAIAPNGTEEEYTLANPATGEIIVDGGTVNANNIDATNGSVTLKKGALNVEETYTGDILATDGTSNVTAATLTGNLLAKNGGQLTVNLGTGTLTANGTGDKNQDFSRGIRAIVDQKGDRSAATIKIQAGNVNATSEKVSAIQAAITWVGDGESISSALAPVIDITTDNLTARSEKEAAVTGQDGNVLIKATNKVTLTTGADSTMGVVYARNHSNDKAMGIVSIEAKTIEILAENADAKAISGNTRGEVNVKASEAVTIKGSIASYNKDMQNNTSGITIDVSGAKVTASGKEINAADDSAVTITGGKGSSLEYVDIIAAAQDKENKSTQGGKINIDFADGGSIAGKITAQNEGEINVGGTITFDSSKTSFTTSTNGIINLTSGIMDGSLNIADGSNVNLTGATFKAADLATALTGAGTLTLKGNGILETVAGQVFTVDDTKLTANDLTNNAVNENAKDKVVFDSGTLKLTDAEYTLDYVTSASGALKTADSKTNILMSGKLAEGGEVKDEISIDQAAGLGDDILLDEVVVRDDSKNILIGTTLNHGDGESTTAGSVTIDKDSKTVANGFSAAQLDLGAESTGVVLTNNETLNLGGSKGGDLVTVGGTTTDDGVKLVIGTESAIGTATETAGTLNIGAFTAPQTDNKLTGSITVNDSSTVNVVNGNLEVTKGVTLAGGTVNVGNGVLTSDVTVTTGASTLTGAAQVGTLTAAAGATLNLGAEDQAAKVAVADLALNGGTLFLDPIWKDGATQDQGTEVTVADADVDGKLIVGQNSTLSLGTDDKGKAREVFAKSGLTWSDSDTLAAVYVAAPITLNATDGTKGGLYVDPTANSGASVTDNSVIFNNGSVLMVDGTAVTETAAISGVTGGVTVGDEAKLYIDGAKKGEEYKILAGTSLNTGTVWQDENIISDNKLLKFTGDATTDNNAYDVTAELQKVNQVFNGQVVIGNVVNVSLASDKADAAQNFFNNAVSSKYNATDADAVNALNSVANMGELAGVSRGTYSMSNIMTDAVSKHLSLANHAEADKDIWAHYIHSKEEVRDMEMGGMSGSYDMKYNGIVVGGDFYNKGKATAGVALSYAKGDVDSIGNSVTTKNDAEYYGLSLYGRINNGDSSVLGDISYLHGKNDITQTNSGTVITAAPKTDAFSIGVKAEKSYTMGAAKLVPYAGLRYLHLGVGDYSNSLGMHYNADDQNMWLLPVGVTYSYETKAGDWTIRPLVEAGYVWTAGDRDTKQTVSLNGASDGFGFNVADSGSFVGRFALEAEKANIAFGLGYEYQKGDSVKANRLMANVRFSF